VDGADGLPAPRAPLDHGLRVRGSRAAAPLNREPGSSMDDEVHSSAEATAEWIAGAFADFDAEFREITRRSRRRFERREWRGAQDDARERLSAYARAVSQTVSAIGESLRGTRPDAALGRAVRRAYDARVARRPQAELAQTFYNSVVRRVFGIVGVSPDIEYVDAEPCRPAGPGADRRRPIHRVYGAGDSTAALVTRIVEDSPFEAPFRSLREDAVLAAERIDAATRRAWADPGYDAIEMLPPVFYRNKGGYRVGRIRRGEALLPLLLPLTNMAEGIAIDAVLLDPDEVSVVFGFTRSYFHVDVERPRAVVDFLGSIMPQKRLDELYTSIGYNKHGKRELFRSICCELQGAEACFEPAPGERGMVMSVFTLPALNVVFKVIRDHFAFPKETTRERVMERYDFVFARDRVGRLADAQEFEHLEFHRRHFTEPVLTELLRDAAGTVRLEGDTVVIEHLYTERLVTPLNLFLQQADEAAALDALADYGYAIQDLAAADIFPGDMLLKNFGVTRHGRVIFYDYDELCLLGDCRFRRMPAPRDDHDEMAAEPHFHVREGDVFPEEFESFLVPRGPLRRAFRELHGELFEAEFWQRMQQRQQEGEVVDVFPYRQERRLRP
jgi:isocitrate dehydrogenase kinase/phosphatase